MHNAWVVDQEYVNDSHESLPLGTGSNAGAPRAPAARSSSSPLARYSSLTPRRTTSRARTRLASPASAAPRPSRRPSRHLEQPSRPRVRPASTDYFVRDLDTARKARRILSSSSRLTIGRDRLSGPFESWKATKRSTIRRLSPSMNASLISSPSPSPENAIATSSSIVRR